MAETSAIEWTDSTWNPVTGCTRVSPGCAHCYIETTIPFRTKRRRFERVGNEETTGLILHEERLDPKKVPKGPRIFVNSLSDLFHEEIPTEFIFRALDVMADLPERTFQVLTKRPAEAQAVLGNYYDRQAPWGGSTEPPLPNVWLGVSIENARYTWRADVLREIPAAVRFISAEPLLGSLFEHERPLGDPDDYEHTAACDGEWPCSCLPERRKPLDLTGIDWLIVGGESGGKQARPMHPEWARELRDACHAGCECPDPLQGPHEPSCSRPTFFFKQWGSWSPVLVPATLRGDVCLSEDGTRYDVDEDYVCAPNESDGEWMRYAGARPKSGGRELDGRTWDETPTAAPQEGQ